MTPTADQNTAVSGPAPEQESNPQIGENQPLHEGLCANPRCRKGPDGTRGVLKSPRAKYCCPYRRVDVCRRSRPKPDQIEKPTRKTPERCKIHVPFRKAARIPGETPPIPITRGHKGLSGDECQKL